MFKKLALALWLCLAASAASAQTCPTRPVGDNSNACASTAYVQQNLPTGLPAITTSQFYGGTGVAGAAQLFPAGANVPAWLITPTSANLAAAVPDKTGTGSLVFANSPILVTPNLGTPSAVNLANGTSLPNSATTATSANTPSTIVARDANGYFGGHATRDVGPIFNVLTYGAIGDNSTDGTAAINAAISAAEASTSLGGAVYFPAGKYVISAAITITSPICVYGDGASQTILRQTSGSAGGVQFLYPTSAVGGCLHDLSIEAGAGWIAAGYQGHGSVGVGLTLQNVNGQFNASHFGVHNFDYGIITKGSVGGAGTWGALFDNFNILYFVGDAIQTDPVGATGGDRTFSNAAITNNGFTGTNTSSNGVNILGGGGDWFDKIDITATSHGVVINPTTNNVGYTFFNEVLSDTAIYDAWYLNGSTKNITSVYMINCWGAYSTNGSGLVTAGSGLDDVVWVGGRLRENGAYGWHHEGGSNVYVRDSSIAANSKSSSNTYPGVLVDAGVSNWGLQNSRVGNFASGLTTQADGVDIAPSSLTTDFQITNNNFISPGSGKVGVSYSTIGTVYSMLGNINGPNISAP